MASRRSLQTDAIEKPERSGGVSILRQSATWLFLMLGSAATVFIWITLTLETTQSAIMSGILWMLVLVGIGYLTRCRRLATELEALRAFEDAVIAHRASEVIDVNPDAKMRHVSAWLIGLLGIVATVFLWHNGRLENLLGSWAMLVTGAAVSFMLALMVAANTINRLKTRRMTLHFKSARRTEKTTLETLQSVNVMITACLPTGERTEFNRHFLELLGRSFEELQGKGWLEFVHPDDRQDVLSIVERPLATNETRREHDYCIQHRNGQYIWLRETLTPRFDEKDQLVEFTGTAIDITSQIRNETAFDEQLTDLRAELAETKSELSKTKTARSRLQKTGEESREEIKNLTTSLKTAEDRTVQAKRDAGERVAEAEKNAKSSIARMKDEAKTQLAKAESDAKDRISKLEDENRSTKKELQNAKAENRKFSSAAEKMQDEMSHLRQQESEFREQIVRHIKDIREANAEKEEASKKESQARAKCHRLSTRADELEAKLTEKDEELSAAREEFELRITEMTEEIEIQKKVNTAEALAGQLRQQLVGVTSMTDSLLQASLDGPQLDAINNTAASIRSMSELVDQALGKSPKKSKRKKSANESFDLRRTAQGVQDLLQEAAEQRGLKFEYEVGLNIPGLVTGDDVEIRSALMSLANASFQLADEGTIILRLTEDISTKAYATIRCEISHPNAKPKTDELEEAMAINSTDKDMPHAVKEPVRHQAALAWRTIRRLEGTHGFLLPDTGGFSIWCTFNVGRVAAAAAMKPVRSSAPVPVAPLMMTDPVPATDSNEKRPAPRLPVEFLKCNLGDIVELGGGGLRIFSTKTQKKRVVSVTFENMNIKAEVMWSKKISARKHDVGLDFLDVTPEQRSQILRIAMDHRRVSTMLELD
ncbi:MAG: PAS domain-containing protein [Planctomycetes bacterium]|nr:PAS domain-containing protein [Planctomycetota bacterium]